MEDKRKYPKSHTLKTYRIVEDKIIFGVLLPAFIHNGTYFFTNIAVYQDGMIDCWELVNFDDFVKKVKSGWVITTLPENADVSFSSITNFSCFEILYSVPENEFIKDVADAIEELNDRPSSLYFFWQFKKAFWENPTEENRKLMIESFERVPHHKKKFVTNPRDRKFFKEQGIKSYDTVWELNDLL